MTPKEMEMKLTEIESVIKPDMYESFAKYINAYRIAFYDAFGQKEQANEPDFIQDVRTFLKIDHDAIERENIEGLIDFEKEKNLKLLGDYYSNYTCSDVVFEGIENINVEAVAAYLSKDTRNEPTTEFVKRMREREYQKFIKIFE
ncbi:MAG: hypothetical protein IKY23_02095 [Lachnospiraceae bacterium]|nr:hypothetical protein [Lachnospiraceae bacterium]